METLTGLSQCLVFDRTAVINLKNIRNVFCLFFLSAGLRRIGANRPPSVSKSCTRQTSDSLYFLHKNHLYIFLLVTDGAHGCPPLHSAGPVVLSSPAQLVAPVLVARGTLSITTTEIYFEVDEDDPAFKRVNPKVSNLRASVQPKFKAGTLACAFFFFFFFFPPPLRWKWSTGIKTFSIF